MSVTENPWPVIFVLGIAACVLIAIWYSRQKTIWLVGAGLAVAGCIAAYMIDEAIVTEGEIVEADIRKLVAAFRKKDRETVMGYISKKAIPWPDMASDGLRIVEFLGDLDVKDVSVHVRKPHVMALSRFRVNGMVSVYGVERYVATMWEVQWQMVGDRWIIYDVTRLNPTSGKPMLVGDFRD